MTIWANADGSVTPYSSIDALADAELQRDRHAIVPIVYAQLDPDDKCVVLSGLTRPALWPR